VNSIILAFLFTSNSYGASEEIDSKFGSTPKIDGFIDISTNEWNEATKIQTNLNDLPIELWVMNTDENLYISIQLDLLPTSHNSTEFVGIMISNSSSENVEDFIDARIIQFSNISDNSFDYLDYNINNSVFKNDTISHGDGAAKLEYTTSTYEFLIPIINDNNSDQDASLDYGKSFAFMVTYGVSPHYPSGIRKSAIFLINLASLSTSQPLFLDLAINILVVLVFIVLGALFGFYIYKIFKLNKKMEKIKR
jgi:hypothetical protein